MDNRLARAPDAVLAHLRRRSPSFPWFTASVGACVLVASAPPTGWRDGVANFTTYFLMLVFLGFIGGAALPSFVSYVIRHDDPESVINGVRVAQVVMLLAVAGMWGWTPDSLPADPGDAYP